LERVAVRLDARFVLEVVRNNGLLLPVCLEDVEMEAGALLLEIRTAEEAVKRGDNLWLLLWPERAGAADSGALLLETCFKEERVERLGSVVDPVCPYEEVVVLWTLNSEELSLREVGEFPCIAFAPEEVPLVLVVKLLKTVLVCDKWVVIVLVLVIVMVVVRVVVFSSLSTYLALRCS